MTFSFAIRSVAVAAGMTLFALNAWSADTVNLEISGKVVASPCTTINGGSATLSVPLGDNLQAASLAAAGSGSPMVKFELPLTGCPEGTTNIKATFNGTPDSDNTLWKNTAGTAAANTAVELSNQANNAILSNGSKLDAPVTNGKATYALQARVFSTLGSVKPGDIESVIVVSFEYQ